MATEMGLLMQYKKVGRQSQPLLHMEREMQAGQVLGNPRLGNGWDSPRGGASLGLESGVDVRNGNARLGDLGIEDRVSGVVWVVHWQVDGDPGLGAYPEGIMLLRMGPMSRKISKN